MPRCHVTTTISTIKSAEVSVLYTLNRTTIFVWPLTKNANYRIPCTVKGVEFCRLENSGEQFFVRVFTCVCDSLTRNLETETERKIQT